MVRIASATGVPWATSTSTWRSLATISSGLCLFLDMDPSSFGSEAILQGGPLQRGRITRGRGLACRAAALPAAGRADAAAGSAHLGDRLAHNDPSSAGPPDAHLRHPGAHVGESWAAVQRASRR